MKTNDHRNFGGSFVGLCGTQIFFKCLSADFSSIGAHYDYAPDAEGNRIFQETGIGTTNYLHDNANRLTTVNGVTYTWDNNGNLLSDGVNTYTYDFANHLKTFTDTNTTATYAYNGLGDRLQETVNGITTTFTMDLNMGFTQALSDGTNSYIFGVGRIAQVNTGTEYFLGDALGSVRQLTDDTGEITYARTYDPYGVVTSTLGDSQTSYAFTGEHLGDSTQLTYLRARYYSSGTGRFTTKDVWHGEPTRPISYNDWLYAFANPVLYTDPSGFSPLQQGIDDLPVVLLDPRSLGYYAGQNVDLLPYLFYLNPFDFSFTSSIRYNINNAVAEKAISLLANKFSNIIGQGGIPNQPGDENYPTKFIVEMLGGKTFWRRLIDVNGSTQNLFSAWFVVNNINGRNMVAETFPLNSPENFSYITASVYLKPITLGNNKQIILDSDYLRLSFNYNINGAYYSGDSYACFSIPLTFVSRLVSTDNYFTVRFTTRQTGYQTVETRGEVRLLNNPDPAGLVTLRGNYIGPKWKLHVLDKKIAMP